MHSFAKIVGLLFAKETGRFIFLNIILQYNTSCLLYMNLILLGRGVIHDGSVPDYEEASP
jgi:hypothetical protein